MIDSAEFEHWLQLYMREPWGDDWRQAGTIAAAVHNSQTTEEKHLRTPDSYIPAVKEQRPESRRMSQKDTEQALMRMAGF